MQPLIVGVDLWGLTPRMWEAIKVREAIGSSMMLLWDLRPSLLLDVSPGNEVGYRFFDGKDFLFGHWLD